MNESVGVIIGRFQTPELTGGHRELIEFVSQQGHNQVLVALGVAPVPCTKNNPLHYTARVAMMSAEYPHFIYMPIHDNPSDKVWSEDLDRIIESAFPHTPNITLYGSRDSFKDRYWGKFKVREFEPKTYDNATKHREQYGSMIGFNKDYRHGVVYGAYQKYDTVYQTVDVALFCGKPVEGMSLEEHEIILCKKKIYGDKYLFVGGFVDPVDQNLNQAVEREVKEETGLYCSDIKYIMSTQVKDYRYIYEKDKIMTHFHTAHVRSLDSLKALDDIDSLEIVKMDQWLSDNMAPCHVPLMSHLITTIKCHAYHANLES